MSDKTCRCGGDDLLGKWKVDPLCENPYRCVNDALVTTESRLHARALSDPVDQLLLEENFAAAKKRVIALYGGRGGDKAVPLATRRPFGVKRPSPRVTEDKVTALFGNLSKECVSFVTGADGVVGCMAWLTDSAVITALATVPTVSLLVHQDLPVVTRPQTRLAYGRLTCDAVEMKKVLRSLVRFNPMGYPEHPVYSVGTGVTRPGTSTPQLHHKFLVRLERGEKTLEPVAVWTGSFNATVTGGRNLENAVIIRDEVIARRYATEWAWTLGHVTYRVG